MARILVGAYLSSPDAKLGINRSCIAGGSLLPVAIYREVFTAT